MIEVIDTEEKFDAAREEWERIDKADSVAIQQTHLWCRTAWDSLEDPKKRLFVLKWFQEGRDDTVFFPLYIDGKGVCRFIYDVHCDRCDSVHTAAALNRYWAYREAANAILAEKRIKSVWLQKMTGESEALHYLSVFLPGALVAKDNAYSWIDMEQSDDYFNSAYYMKSKDKADIKAILRKSGNRKLEVLAKNRGNPFPEEKIAKLADTMRASGARGGGFFPQTVMRFARTLYESQKIEIAVLSEGEEWVAINFLLLANTRALSWIFLQADNKASTELYAKYFVEQCHNRKPTFDFGVGVYSYKIGTFRPQVAPTFCLRYGKSPLLHLRQAVAANIRFAKDYAKAWLARRRG